MNWLVSASRVLSLSVMMMSASGFVRVGRGLSSRLLFSTLLAPASIDYTVVSRRGGNVFVERTENHTSVTCVPKSGFDSFRQSISNNTVALSQTMGGPGLDSFPGTKLVVLPPETATEKPLHLLFFDDSVPIATVSLAAVVSSLKSNKTYSFEMSDGSELKTDLATLLCQAHALKSHKFSFLRSRPESPPSAAPATIVWPKLADRRAVLAMSRSVTLYKDLVDSPALSLGPAQLAQTAASIANELGASSVEVTVGVENLLSKGYPQVAAVGMASSEDRLPRVVDIRWSPSSVENPAALPVVVIVGKGVCFDTGGLNIKGAGGMRQMKKDMAGAAQALALALLIMEHQIPVSLRVLLPCVENSISGVALRPGDVIQARNGLTTEITNTDAEGRLILADCLVAACEGGPGPGPGALPALVVDFATLTGAARVALGTELPALFSNNHTELMRLFDLSQSAEVADPMWPLPLWGAYKPALKSTVADLVNAAEGAGAITAALYLSEFVAPLGGGLAGPPPIAGAADGGKDTGGEGDAAAGASISAAGPSKAVWFHVDFMGTKGGVAEPQGMKAVFEYIKRHVAAAPGR